MRRQFLHLTGLLFASTAWAVPAGFEIHEFVGPSLEPELYPTAISAAAGGDLYISSDPNGSLDHNPAFGRVLIARDTKGTGKADQLIEFVKVTTPRGGHAIGGAFYLIHPPYLSVFRDLDGDGKADKKNEKKVLVEGLGGGIEHPRGGDHTTNGCRMGIDGWIYIAVGDFGAGIAKDKAGAKGTDGGRVTLYGGGVMRVRPDGSELEVYAEMARNICDVAISPQLDLFSRDNTNDGKGWNTRFHHFTALANTGYPRLYKNFAHETALPLADYGGGSGTGALYLSEPGFPAGFGQTLFTCDWTTGTLHAHPIKPFEATFIAKQTNFQSVPHAIDVDVDGSSRLYLADWRGAAYTYAGKGKHVGLIHQITAPGIKRHQYKDVTKASDAELVNLLASESSVQRLEASRHIIDSGKKALAKSIITLAGDSRASVDVRIAAIFTYKQLLGRESSEALVQLCRDDAVREFALRALADRLTELQSVPSQPFVAALADLNPRVRLQALIGLSRLKVRAAAPDILKIASSWPTDESKLETGAHYRLPHTAVKTLVQLNNVPALAAALRVPATRELARRALQEISTIEAVEAAVVASRDTDPATRFAAFTVLARLYNREADWNYTDWWNTRPDDRGPYFKPVSWDGTEKCRTAIEAFFSGLSVSQRDVALEFIPLNRIEIASLKLPGVDPLRQALASQKITPADLALLESAALQSSRSWDERAACYRAVMRAEGDAALKARIHVLAGWAQDTLAPSVAQRAIDDFVNDGARGPEVKKLRALAATSEDATARIIWRALLTVLNSPLVKEAQKKEVRSEVNKNPEDIGFFLALADLRLSGFDAQIDAALKRDSVALMKAAQAARLAVQAQKASSGKKVSELSVAEVTTAALKGKGDVQLGKRLFTQQGCIACHSVDLTAEQKGPYLGAAGAKFTRDYLIESILDPNKAVAQGFQTVVFQMKDGTTQMGFIVGEADGVVSLRNIAGQSFKLRRTDVKSENHLPQSMMPAGLGSGLTVDEFTSMIEYMVSLKAIGG